MDVEYLRQQLDIAAAAIQNCQAQLPPPEDAMIVSPDDDIQRVIDSAAPGAIIEFAPGRYVLDAPLTVPNKSVTLRAYGSVPSRRVTPSDALPHLVASGGFAILDGSNARLLRVIGLHFEGTGQNDVITLDEADDVILEKIVILGGEAGAKRGIQGNGSHITVIDSYVGNIWRQGQDSQAFCAWNSKGYITLDNCYLEVAGENVMFGGADSVDADHIPSNILIRNCDFSKRPEWKERQGFYSVKNLFESKCARNVTVENCRFGGCWTDAQNGYAIVLKSANQDGNAPWSVTEHVHFKNCTVTNSENGINIQGTEGGAITDDITFENCRFTVSGTAIQVGAGAGRLDWRYCTFDNGYNFLSMYANSEEQKAIGELVMHHTQGHHNQYGVRGDDVGIGQPALDRYVGVCDWQHVLLLNPEQPFNYPPTTYFTRDEVPDGVEIGAS